MKKILTIITILGISFSQTFSQTYPTFGIEIPVTITGLTFDAMEPFISLDGNTLFFNSLNSGGNTNLYYATKVNDSTFNYIGLVGGCYDPSTNHLDAVASIDSLTNFFWVSLRNLPNLYRGKYSNGTVKNSTRVYGSFNIFLPNWIIMDAAINYNGNELYYCNAYFDSACAVGIPCKTKMGFAQKINDSIFDKALTSDAVFSNINDTNYLVYAPIISKDGLEFYYTRLLRNTVNTEICVSVRNNVTDPFSLPLVIYFDNGFFPEAPTLTIDKQKLYYHKKSGGLYKLFLRYRNSTLGIDHCNYNSNVFAIYPNPANQTLTILSIDNQFKTDEILFYNAINSLVKIVPIKNKMTQINITDLPSGVYFIRLKNQPNQTQKFIKQ